MSIAEVTVTSVEYASDSLRWDCETQGAMVAMRIQLTQDFGERCGDFQDGCPCCDRWKAFDTLFENPFK